MPSRLGPDCVGVLLAGGESRRFGGAPKGLAVVGGLRIADRALASLAGATARQLVSTNDPRAAEWFPGSTRVPDLVAGVGPLAALATALRAAEGAAVLVVAWDMPFVTPSLLGLLRARGEAARTSVVPVHGDGRAAEPLCAYYRPEALPVAEGLLAAGERRARALFERLRAREQAVALDEWDVAKLGEPASLFLSVDSPAVLAALGGEPPPDVTTA